MKLLLKIPTAIPRLLKVQLQAGLVELLDAYMDYYKIQLGATLTIEQVMTEIMTAFIKSDRDFMRWYHVRTVKHEKPVE